MRTALLALRATGAAAVLVAASAATLGYAPPAAAEEERRGTVQVSPSPAAPGEQVRLKVEGCASGVAKSEVFVADAELSGGGGDRGTAHGDAMIRSRAEPGWYTVHVSCHDHGRKATGSIRIGHRQPSHHPSPVWPVHAGGGGMSAELAAARKDGDEGPGLPHTVIGAVLACAATLAVAGRALRLRRRRSGE
ncbi:hypothetical protein LG634_24110 [Streptomyces bambusae]|uniref:hypothetical protein n=1 Tax=Streptomyces bambusae TaxID=1550616 RepID=UPI001CFF319B|nr:hypothetical protein [Streptomyces bambusae]MCB5167900.1 hypothetical protein [Streptomyces bambusae]